MPVRQAFLWLTALLAVVYSDAAHTAELAVPPYLQLGDDGALTVMWCTDKPAYSWIEYGETPDLGQKADRIVEGLRAANTTRHQVRIPVKEFKELHYRIGWKVIDSFGAYRVDFQNRIHRDVSRSPASRSGRDRAGCHPQRSSRKLCSVRQADSPAYWV